MSFVQGNEVVFAITKQASPSSGVPVTPTWDVIPRTGGDIDDPVSTTTSSLVDDTRQGARPVKTGESVTGNIPSELQTNSPVFKLFTEGALQNTIGADINYNAATISFDNGSSEIRDSALGFTDIDVGEYFVPYGAATADNIQVYLVTAKADNGTLTVSPAPTTEAAGSSVTIKGANIRSNKNEQGFSVQKRIPASDGTVYYTFEGVQISTLGVSVTTESILTTTVDMLGLNKRDGVTQIAGSSDNAETDARVLGSIDGVPQIFIDSVSKDPSTVVASDLSFTVDNGSSSVPIVGSATSACIAHGAIGVTGTLNTYVGDTVADVQAEKLKASNLTEFQLALAFKDGDNNYIVVDFPTVQYTSLTQADTANGDSLQNTGSFTAHGKNSSDYTIGVTFIESV